MNKLFLIPLLLVAIGTKAQTSFYSSVKVEYEKTVNVHAYYKELDEEWFDWIRDKWPKVATSYYEFTGNATHSIYKPGREVPVSGTFGYRAVADKNVVYNTYVQGTTVSQKPVFEETFLMQDSLAKIEWRLTPDTRTIAGFECRKAVGILDDSVAVFAFYSDELMIPGGPEGIHGLPGLILGVGVPRLHATWFATKVEVFDVNMQPVTPATKGKKVTRRQMLDALDKVLRGWGNYGSKLIVNYEI